MSDRVHTWLGITIFVAVVAGFIALIVALCWSTDKRNERLQAAARAPRDAFCEQICANKHQSLYRMSRGGGEWRCFCSDGYWQPIP